MNQTRSSSSAPVVTVVGGGLGGLMVAERLAAKGLRVRVFEKGPRWGGLVSTIRTQHGPVETAANGVLNTAQFEAYIREIGLEHRLVGSKTQSRRRYLWLFGGPQPLPLLWPWRRGWTFNLLSRGLAFVLRLLFARGSVQPRPRESIRAFGSRALGQSITDEILATGLQGIYSGDPESLSATLILGRALSRKSQKTPSPDIRGTVSFENGMQDLVDRLVERLIAFGAELRLNHSWPEANDLLQVDRGPLVLATSGPAAGRLIGTILPARASAVSDGTLQEISNWARRLSKMKMASLTSTTVFCKTAPSLSPGFGVLFPQRKSSATGDLIPALGVLFNTWIFPSRSTGSSFSMTWISDPTRHGQPLSLIEQGRWPLVEEILTRVQTEWSEALPVYDLDLEDTLREGQAALQQLEACEIYLVGNYLGEIGLAKIMRLAADVAEKIAKKAD